MWPMKKVLRAFAKMKTPQRGHNFYSKNHIEGDVSQLPLLEPEKRLLTTYKKIDLKLRVRS